MTLEEYIEKNFSEEQLNEYSYFSGWHNAILEIVRETWVAAQQSVQADGVFCSCKVFIPSYESTAVKCRTCGKPPRR